MLSISFCSRGFAFCAVGKLYNSTNSKLQAVGLSGSSILCVKHVLHTNDFSQMIKSFSHVVVQSNKLSVVSRWLAYGLPVWIARACGERDTPLNSHLTSVLFSLPSCQYQILPVEIINISWSIWVNCPSLIPSDCQVWNILTYLKLRCMFVCPVPGKIFFWPSLQSAYCADHRACLSSRIPRLSHDHDNLATHKRN